MPGIIDRDRVPSGDGTPTRNTINISRTRSSSNMNPSQIDILRIDDSKARKTLEDFYEVAKEGAKSTSDGIRKMWSMSTKYSDEYRKQAIENINKLEDKRNAAHEKEVHRINTEYRDKHDRDKALAQEMKQYNLDRIKYIKEINNADRQGLEIQKQAEELRKKYSGTRLGKKIQSDIDKSQELRVKLEAEYNKASSGKLSKDELIKVAENTDELEGKLDEVNKRIERSIDKSERRSEGIRNAVKGFIKDAVTNLTHNLTEGVTGYFNAYEDSFTNFAGRLQTSYDETRKFYEDSVADFRKAQLTSVANFSKDMIPAMTQAVNNGFKDSDAVTKAIADVESKIIMPWLDTSSEAWINMSFSTNKQNLEILKSQQLQLQQSKEGNRLLQSGVIGSMTSEMEPLLRNIDFNTGGAANMSAEAQAIMAGWVSQGMSPQEAYAQMQKMISIQKDQYGALTSGDVTKVLMGSVADQGYRAMAEAVMPLYDIASRGSNLEASALNNILGLDLSAGTSEIAREWVDGVKKSADYTYEASTKIWEKAVKDINSYTTDTARFQNAEQNAVIDIAKFLTSIPEGDRWFSSVLDLIKGISAAVLGGTVIDKLFDVLGSSRGIDIFSRLLGRGTPTIPTSPTDTTATDAAVAGGTLTALKNKLTGFISNTVNKVGGTAGLQNIAFVGDWLTHNTPFRNLNPEYGGSIFDGDSWGKAWDELVTPIKNNVENGSNDYLGSRPIGLYNSNDYISDVASRFNTGTSDFGREDKVKELYELLWDHYRSTTDRSDGGWDEGSLLAESTGLTKRQYTDARDRLLKYYQTKGNIDSLDDSFFSSADTSDWFVEPDLSNKATKYKLAFESLADKYYSLYRPHMFEKGLNNSTKIYEYSFTDDEEDELWKYAGSELGLARGDIEIILPIIYDLAQSQSGDFGRYHRTYGMTDDFWNTEYGQRLANDLNFSYAVGTPYISADQIAMLHKGERVLTARENEVFGDIGSTGLLLAGSSLINRLLGITNFDDSDDISREDMTETLVQSIEKITTVISGLAQNTGINYENRTLPRITNNYNSNLVNLVPSISTSK